MLNASFVYINYFSIYILFLLPLNRHTKKERKKENQKNLSLRLDNYIDNRILFQFQRKVNYNKRGTISYWAIELDFDENVSIFNNSNWTRNEKLKMEFNTGPALIHTQFTRGLNVNYHEIRNQLNKFVSFSSLMNLFLWTIKLSKSLMWFNENWKSILSMKVLLSLLFFLWETLRKEKFVKVKAEKLMKRFGRP